MIHLGLSAAERRAYLTRLHDSADVRIRVTLLDMDEKPLRDLTFPDSKLLDGYITVDATAKVTRSLQLELLDPDGRFVLDPTSPGRAALFADNFVQIHYEVSVDREWISCPAFRGPITKLDINGPRVTVEAQGKERLALDPHLLWRTKTYRKGADVIEVIRDLLERIGEERFNLDSTSGKLPKDLTVTRHDEAWLEAKKLAEGIDRQLFYDGRGRVRLRKRPKRVGFTFFGVEDGDRPSIVLTRPQLGYDFNFVNTVEVLGPKPTGKKRRVRGLAQLRPGHQLSSTSLARNGVKLFVVHRLENSKVKRSTAATAIAERILEDKARVGVEVSFEALPIPFLEENDLIRVVTDEGTHQFRLQRFVLPLSVSAGMQVGVARRPSAYQRRRNRGGRRER